MAFSIRIFCFNSFLYISAILILIYLILIFCTLHYAQHFHCFIVIQNYSSLWDLQTSAKAGFLFLFLITDIARNCFYGLYTIQLLLCWLSGEGGVGTLDGLQLVHLQGLMDVLRLSVMGVFKWDKQFNTSNCTVNLPAEVHTVKYIKFKQNKIEKSNSWVLLELVSHPPFVCSVSYVLCCASISIHIIDAQGAGDLFEDYKFIYVESV